MDSTIGILKSKIESLTLELAEAFIRIIDNMDTTSTSAISQFQLDEVFDRIQFHNENPSTKLDFFENISEFEKICA